MRLDRLRIRAAVQAAVQRREDSPLPFRRWKPGQHRFLASGARYKLFRAGNQAIGKTEAGAAETVYRLLGRHPLRVVRPAPVSLLCMYGGGAQGRVIQERLWSLVPKSEVRDDCWYDPRKGGFVGKYPRLRLRNGSEVEFLSSQGDLLNLAGRSPDGIWVDEPPDNERVWNELVKRVTMTMGDIWLTLTPVNRPVDYLRELVALGIIEDIHCPLTPGAMIPVGSTRPVELADGTLCDAAWIAQRIAETPRHEVPVTIHGEWEFRAADAYFGGAWLPDDMVHTRIPSGQCRVLLGIDHGDRPGKQVALLILVAPDGAVYVLDEYVDDGGLATPADDAAALLAMLQRHGMTWRTLDEARGDRIHMPGHGGSKSNRDLERHLARLMGLRTRQVQPPIRTVKRGRGRGSGSVQAGSRWLFAQMVAGKFGVHPRCERLIEALPKYTGKDDDYKDPVDALRYGLDSYIFAVRGGVSRVLTFAG